MYTYVQKYRYVYKIKYVDIHTDICTVIFGIFFSKQRLISDLYIDCVRQFLTGQKKHVHYDDPESEVFICSQTFIVICEREISKSYLRHSFLMIFVHSFS